MTIKHDNLVISIFSDSAYSLDSTDNLNNYDKKYFDESDYIFPSIYTIKVAKNGEEFSAVIGSEGGATAASNTSVIVDNNKLFMCCGDSVYCLSLPELNLNWKTKADMITCFELFKIDNFFIVHGELQISRLSLEGVIEWQQSGKDIFVTPNGKNDFEIKNGIIIAKDCDNDEYKFDFEGNVIN
ncbi:hypothetical protein [Flavobacterium proteolyticum]|uniref:Uncharacterized protein n=1 Tax=Flavobacterium proteolyticum TaxID=2911683 RepID=A0ABR9WU85_9FLAO|nr:hypothetical protein [Flavobacterium proteolyticum]MBE9577220.1 hypothetical protein [Flavobacterium proteolyticum]